MPNSLNDRFPHSTSKLARLLADLTGFQSLEPSTEPEDWRDARYIIDPEGVHYCDYRLNWMIGEMLAISNHVRTMRLLSRSWPSVDALLDSHSHVNRKGCAVLTVWSLISVCCGPSLRSGWRVDLVPYLLILVFQVHFLVSARTQPFLGRALWRAIGLICNESSKLLMERPRVGPSL